MSEIYSAFTLIEDVIEYKNNGGKCSRFQFFISDPSKLRILKDDSYITESHKEQSKGFPRSYKSIIRESDYIIASVKQYKIDDFIIHGSYLIGDMTKPFQIYILKQELEIAQRAGASAYIIHAHSSHALDIVSVIRKRFKIHIVVENTSHAINEDDITTYKRKLISQPVVIDTAHLYSSGLARTSDQMLSIIRSAALRKTLFALHFNDQEGMFGRGLDRHAAIGIGRVFFQYPDQFFNDSELVAYAARSCDRIVFEFTDNTDYEYIYMLFNAFAHSNVVFDQTRLVKCGAVVQAISEFLDPDDKAYEYRKLHYQATAAQLIEIGEKEKELQYDDKTWRAYKLEDKVLGFLFFAILVQQNRKSQRAFSSIYDMYAPQLKGLDDYRITLKQASSLFLSICKELNLKPNKQVFVCGSVRRECSMIGDIDILIVTPRDRKDYIKRIVSLIEDSNILEYQREQTKTSNVYMEEPPMILRLQCAGVNVDVYFASEDQKPTMLLFLTGNRYFNISMRAIAKRKGFKLSGYTLEKGQKRIAIKTEEEVFKKLGLSYVKPRYRTMWLGSLSA